MSTANSIKIRGSRWPNSQRPAGARNKVLRAKQEQRRLEAEARAAARAKRSPAQQLVLLDERLGQGVGAARERTRLGGLVALPAPIKLEKKQKVR